MTISSARHQPSESASSESFIIFYLLRPDPPNNNKTNDRTVAVTRLLLPPPTTARSLRNRNPPLRKGPAPTTAFVIEHGVIGEHEGMLQVSSRTLVENVRLVV